MAFHDYAVDDISKTIRGGFVNLCVTIMMSILITIGCFVPTVALNIEKMAVFMLGFWGISFGFWKTAGLVESYTDKKFNVPKPWDGRTERRTENGSASSES